LRRRSRTTRMIAAWNLSKESGFSCACT
jgi:hypothetical protein